MHQLTQGICDIIYVCLIEQEKNKSQRFFYKVYTRKCLANLIQLVANDPVLENWHISLSFLGGRGELDDSSTKFRKENPWPI